MREGLLSASELLIGLNWSQSNSEINELRIETTSKNSYYCSLNDFNSL